MKTYNIHLKSSWKDLTIEDYQKIYALGEDIKKTDIISIISNMTLEEVMDLPLEVLQSLEDEIEFINEGIEAVYELSPVRTQNYRWTLLTDIKKLKASQFMDLIELTKDKSKLTENLHMIMSVISNKEEKRWYGGYKKIDYQDRDIMADAKVIQKHFPIGDALSLSSFFLAILELSQINIEDYSDKTSKQSKRMDNIREEFPQ